MRPIFRFAAIALAASGAAAADSLEGVTVPAGFHISVLTDEVPSARGLAFGQKHLFVGSRNADKVYVVDWPPGADGRAKARVVLDDLTNPHGVAFKDGALYVGERTRITRYDAIEDKLDAPPAPAVVLGDLPDIPHHGMRTIRFGPDGLLYLSIGVPCNVCERKDPFGQILRLDAKAAAAKPEIYATGIRNSVGFDWDASGALWFTDNGRDLLGDDIPDDELNHAPKPGMDFGFPYCHAGTLADGEFGKQRPCKDFVAPAYGLGAHVAALGMAVYDGNAFPAEYQGAIFIAEHGSWNRSSKVGYRVVVAKVKDGKVQKPEVFATGWLKGQRVSGRPVDVVVAPDGSLIVSDDDANALYRIEYKK